jgi:hypothetical protein
LEYQEMMQLLSAVDSDIGKGKASR